MIRGMPRRYTAIQYAVFNPRSHELQVASAGMPGPFHLSAGGCRNLQLSGVPPGLFAAASYETLTLRLQAGDSVLFCTDGITDAFDRKEDQFGIERLQAVCDAQRIASPTALLERLFAAVESFCRGQEQQDDMAAAVFHFLRLSDTGGVCSQEHSEGLRIALQVQTRPNKQTNSPLIG